MSIDNSMGKFPQLETKRLVLREMRPEDAETLFRMLSDEEVMRYYDRPSLTCLVEAQQIIERHHARFERIEAEVVPGNLASMRLLQKLGFQEEGILRERLFVNNHFSDVKLFSLLRNEHIKEE